MWGLRKKPGVFRYISTVNKIETACVLIELSATAKRNQRLTTNNTMDASASKIQKWWRGHSARQLARQYIEFTEYGFARVGEINPMLPETATEMEYCADNACLELWNGYWWKHLVTRVKEALWLDEFTGGPGAVYYNRVEAAVDRLEEDIRCLAFGLDEEDWRKTSGV
jgi:hypothetical protein